MEIGQPYPDPSGLVAIVPSTAPAADLQGKMVCVTGAIASQEGTPTVQIADASRIVVAQ